MWKFTLLPPSRVMQAIHWAGLRSVAQRFHLYRVWSLASFSHLLGRYPDKDEASAQRKIFTHEYYE